MPGDALTPSTLRALLDAGAKWFAYDPECGVEMYDTEKEARESAQRSLDDLSDAAGDDGWHESTHEVRYGVMLAVGQAVEVNHRDVPEDERNGRGFDFYCDYVLQPCVGAPDLATARGLAAALRRIFAAHGLAESMPLDDAVDFAASAAQCPACACERDLAAENAAIRADVARLRAVAVAFRAALTEPAGWPGVDILREALAPPPDAVPEVLDDLARRAGMVLDALAAALAALEAP